MACQLEQLGQLAPRPLSILELWDIQQCGHRDLALCPAWAGCAQDGRESWSQSPWVPLAFCPGWKVVGGEKRKDLQAGHTGMGLSSCL